jgi:hypothetical protein
MYPLEHASFTELLRLGRSLLEKVAQHIGPISDAPCPCVSKDMATNYAETEQQVMPSISKNNFVLLPVLYSRRNLK